VTPSGRLWVLLLVVLGLLLATRDAPGDERIARRLAALKVLADPAGARPVVSAAPRAAGDACLVGRAAWWRMTGYGVRARIDTAVRDASLRFLLDPALVHSVIREESNYDFRAVSPKGAMGLMQLMPRTAAELGVVCAFDPRENVLAGSRYLRRLYDRLGSWPRAVAAYHAGPTRVEAGRIPGETRRYTERVMRRWRPHRRAGIRF
jgi:soluble lytic murein transglycosylase-like protein